MTDKPQTPAPDWDARARETIALCDHDWSDAERHIAAALRSAHASGLSERDAGWQSIDSAPRDGSIVLLFLPESRAQDGVVMGYWSATDEAPEDDAWYMCDGLDGGTMIDVEVTHWRPLPAPPDPKDQQA